MKLPPQRDDESRWKQIGKLIFIPPGFVLFKILVVLRSTGTESWLYPSKMMLVAGCYGGIAWWMARVRRIRGWRLWLWVIFAGMLGPSGLFVVPSILTSFPSVRCRSCNKRVWVSEAKCPHCGIPVDPPRMEGIEIGPSSWRS